MQIANYFASLHIGKESPYLFLFFKNPIYIIFIFKKFTLFIL